MARRPVDLTTVSLFSGAGGFDLGFEAVGFSTLFATDVDPACCETLRANQRLSARLKKPFLQHAAIVESCVKEINAKDIFSCTGLEPGGVDLMIGGPPCQSFSVIGRRNGRNDANGRLLDDYLRLLAGIQPRAFIFENVKGITSIDNRALFSSLIKEMEHPALGLNYKLSTFVLNSSDYGVPQNRERVFIIGSRQGHSIAQLSPITNDDSSSWRHKRTVDDGFRNLPPAGSDFPANHRGRLHSERIAKRYASLCPGERDPKTRINKLDLSKPSFTVVSGSEGSGGKGHIHPTEPREVTPRESARLQTFPDWWEFKGLRASDARRQIGNAVPPLLAAVIANEIRHVMFRLPKLGFDCIISILDQIHLDSPDEAKFES